MLNDNDTRLSELQAQLDTLKTALQKTEADKTQAVQNSTHFLAHLSHEIRTPLNIILGFTDLLTAEITSPQQRERLEAISSNSRHLLNLINKVLHFAKLDASLNQIELAPLELQHLLAELRSMFQESLAERGIALKIELKAADSIPQYIQTDADRLKEVLINLVANAAKFTEAGYIELSLAHHPPHSLRIQVSDTGCGIPAEDLPTIFRPFAQANNQKDAHQQGTGLGLAIVNKNVQLLGGELSVISEEGKGTCFSFSIPCEETEAPQTIEVHTSPEDIQGLAQKAFNILVVDDHQANRELLYQILAPYPFKLREASNGVEALESIRRIPPDLVLLDLAMPILDGEATIRKLRAQESTRNLPILVLSAMAFEENKQSALRAGANGFIAKPFKKEHLLASLFDLLNIAIQPQELAPSYQADAPTTPSESEAVEVFPPDAWIQRFKGILQELDPMQIEATLEEVKYTHPGFFKKASHWINTFAFSELETWLKSQTP